MRLSVDELIDRINSFPDSDFGEPFPTPACTYKPKHVPPSYHPRMGFTQKKLEKLKKDLDINNQYPNDQEAISSCVFLLEMRK